MKKRLLSVFLVLVLVLSVGTVSFATDDISNTNQSSIKVTDDIVSEIASNWAKSLYPDLNVEVDNIVKIYNSQNIVTSYSVGYFVDGQPYGYAIVDFTIPGYIGEYNIGAEYLDMYTLIITESEISTYSVEEPKLLTGMPFEYAVPVGETVVSISGETKEKSEYSKYQDDIESSAPSTFSSNNIHSGYYDDSDIFIDSVPTFYKRVAENSLPEFIALNQVDVEALTGSYACAPVALAIIARLGYLEFDPIEAYKELWNYTSTDIDKLENGIAYGGTRDNMIGPGFVRYAKEVCNTNVTSQLQRSVSFSRLRSLIDNGTLHTFIYTIYVNNVLNGHCIVPQGYVIATNGNGSSQENFLLIADGWRAQPRYLHFSNRGFASQGVVSFNGISPY